MKRENYINWDEYFMGIALLSSERSKDPSTQVGACIADSEHKVVSVGYNGMPIGIEDNALPWDKEKTSILNIFMSVTLNLMRFFNTRNGASLKGCSL